MPDPHSDLSALRAWEEAHPERVQARKNAWAKSPAGRAWAKANRDKLSANQAAWRARKKAEAQRKKGG